MFASDRTGMILISTTSTVTPATISIYGTIHRIKTFCVTTYTSVWPKQQTI